MTHSLLLFKAIFMVCYLTSSAFAMANNSNELRAADMVLINANIHTLEAHMPKASALAVMDGYIVELGSNDILRKWIGQDTQVIDAEGLTVLPGFIDTHNHVFEGATEVGGSCELDPALSLIELIPILEECAEAIPGKGQWVMGYGHQLNALFGEEGENEERQDKDIDDQIMVETPRQVLDEIFPDNPVVIMEESSHSMMVNSQALKLVGFDCDTPHPQGGIIMRDEEAGELNGILFDNAGDMVMELAWNSQSDVFNKSYDGLLTGLAEVAANGITTVGDGRMYWQRGWFDVWQQAAKEKALTARVSVRPWIYPDLDIDEQLKYLQTIQSDKFEALLVVNQVKMYIDGVMHFGTAKVSRPYNWSWQTDVPTGLYYITPDALNNWLPALDKIGYGAHIHAIGDLGISQAIDAIARARSKGSDQLYGLTHLEMLQRKDFVRFSRYGIDADFQAGASFFANHDWAVPYVGKARAKKMLQMRGVYDAGANVTFGSDWTVNDMNPLMAIANSLRLKRKQGLPDISAALKAATINGARALGLDDVTGSLQVDKSADFVILSADITRLPADKIAKTQIYTTVLMGEVVFDIDG